MIVLNPLTNVQGTEELYSTRFLVQSTGGYTDSPISCFDSCGISLPAFTNLSSNSDRENDKFNFSFPVSSGHYIIATLLKGDDEYIINDQTYGDYEPVGSISTALDWWGFILDFKKVANELGYGGVQLQIEIKLTLDDSTVKTINSPCFEIMPYDCQLADKTVKIFVSQKGYLKNGIDWRGLENTGFEKFEIRTYGRLKEIDPTTVTESVIDSEDKSRQISTGIYSNFTLSLNWMDYLIKEVILKHYMTANPIEISDFNIDSATPFDKVKLKFLSVDGLDKPIGQRQEMCNINLEDYQKDNIKRHGK